MKPVSSFLTIGTLVLATASLAGCQTEAESPQPDSVLGSCRPDAASALAGQQRISDAQAMQLTGATSVRQVQPGDPVTMDFRAERVTIETDPATDTIIRASCG